MLAALGLRGGDDSGRTVTQSHCRLGGVDVLPAFAAGAKRVDIALGEQLIVALR